MNRMLLLLLCISLSLSAFSQRGYLFVKKGIHKKKTYVEGSSILLRLESGQYMSGVITMLRNDTIYINGRPVPRVSVASVIISERQKKKLRLSAKNLLLVTGGAALTTAGIKISGQADFKEALTAGIVIGYGQLVIAWIRSKISLQRRQYPIGRKFQLQILDFHFPARRAF